MYEKEAEVSLYPLANPPGPKLICDSAQFRTWLVEERKINPEVLSKDQTKKEFAKFAEDYNTGKFLRPSIEKP